jgi:hypothetical protein
MIADELKRVSKGEGERDAGWLFANPIFCFLSSQIGLISGSFQ